MNFTLVPDCKIKALLLFYAAERRTFVGFIPNDQLTFVDRFREVVQKQKDKLKVEGLKNVKI